MKIIATIRKHDEYKKFKAIVLRAREKLHIERDRNEALAMHAGRSSRRLFGERQYSPKRLLDASLNDLSCRSRLVEIRVQYAIEIDYIKEAIKSIKHFIATEFCSDLAKFKTVGQRNALIDRVVAGASAIESEGASFIKTLDSLIEDIDKASYHLRAMTEALQLLNSNKGGQVV